MNEKELIEKRNDLQNKMEKILNTAKEENREMNESEIKDFDDLEKKIKNIDETIARTQLVNKLQKKERVDNNLTQEEKDIKAFATYIRAQAVKIQNAETGTQ